MNQETMKIFCKTLLLVLVYSSLWGQNFRLKEITPGYYNGPPSGYISSCQIPAERVFKLKVYVSSSDDQVNLKKIYFPTNCLSGSSNTTILSPTSSTNGTYRAASNSDGQHIEFIIKTKDSYINYFNCDLLADWTYTDKVTTTTTINGVTTTSTTTTITNRQGVVIKNYWYTGGSTEPTSYSYPRTKQCGKDDQIVVVMSYANDIDNYNISATNATVLFHSITPGNSPCDNTITLGLKPELCGDITFAIDRSNSAGNKRDERVIRNEFSEVGVNAIEPIDGETSFCVIDGPVTVTLYGAFNEHFFGVQNPNLSEVEDLLDACPSISANWSVSSSTTPGGISVSSWSPAIDFIYGQVIISSEGEYIINYTLEACGEEVVKKIKLKACASEPYILSTPPIDIQNICSLEDKICAPLGGCIDEIKVTQNDNRFHSIVQGNELCFSSSYVRNRVNPIQVSVSNACGDATANWDIYIDDPEYCEGSGYEMLVEQGTQTVTLHLAPITKNFSGSSNEQEKEIIEKVLVYDINGRLVWSDNVHSMNNHVTIPNNIFKQAGTYVIQAITNVNNYSQPFIRH